MRLPDDRRVYTAPFEIGQNDHQEGELHFRGVFGIIRKYPGHSLDLNSFFKVASFNLSLYLEPV